MTRFERIRLTGIAIILAGCVPEAASATIIVGPPSPCRMFTAPDIVIFRGTVLDITSETLESLTLTGEPPVSVLRVRLSVDEPVRDATGETLALFSSARSQSVDLFTVGESYLVYARRDRRGLWLDWRLPLRDARVDLEILRELSLGRARSRLYGVVQLHRSALRGYSFYTVEGRRLPGVKVFASTAAVEHEATTDSDGSFQFTGLAPGRYTVRVDTTAPLQPLIPTPNIVDLDACAARVQVDVIVESVTGTVRRHDGLPAPGASVVIVDADQLTRARSAETRSDDAGFHIPGVPDGRYLIGVNLFRPPTARSPYPATWYPGSRDARGGQIIVLRDEQPVHLDIILPPPLPVRTIHGRVEDASGQPVRNATVCLIDEEFPDVDECRDFTDGEGEFTVQSVVGRRVRARARDLNPPRESDASEIIDGVADKPVTLRLSKRLPDLVIFQ